MRGNGYYDLGIAPSEGKKSKKAIANKAIRALEKELADKDKYIEKLEGDLKVLSKSVDVRKIPTLDEIIEVVCNRYQVSFEDILSKGRTGFLPTCRMYISYLAIKNIPRIQAKTIGTKIGKGHSMILHYIREMDETLPVDRKLATEIIYLTNLILSHNDTPKN